MVKGVMYSIIIVFIIFACIVGELIYRYRIKELKKEYPYIKTEYLIDRFDCYVKGIGICLLFCLVVVLIIAMIATWNNPL